MFDVVRVECEVTCPKCGHAEWMPMESDYSPYVYQCDRCLTVSAPAGGECCLFCAFGSSQCLPRQKASAAFASLITRAFKVDQKRQNDSNDVQDSSHI